MCICSVCTRVCIHYVDYVYVCTHFHKVKTPLFANGRYWFQYQDANILTYIYVYIYMYVCEYIYIRIPSQPPLFADIGTGFNTKIKMFCDISK